MTNRERTLTRRRLLAGSAGTTALLGLSGPAGASPTDVVDGLLDDGEYTDALQVGAGAASMAWRAGAKPGQVGTGAGTSYDRDPYPYSTIAEPGDGVHGEPTAKAVVLEAGGERYAVAKADSFLMHEQLHRRVADLVSGLGIDREHLLISSTHNHSAPHTTTTGAAVAAFTDVFDIRHWSYQTRQLAAAIERAVASLQPATVRAIEGSFDAVQENIIGPETATEKATTDRGPLDAGNTDDYDTLTDEDGDPIRAGFPETHVEHQFVVLRFDTPGGEPIAATVTMGMHPESLSGGHGLTTSEFVGMVERHLESHVGEEFVATFLNGPLGDVEPSRGNVGQPDWWRESVARTEEMAELIGVEAVRLFERAGRADVPDRPRGPPADPPVGPPEDAPVDPPADAPDGPADGPGADPPGNAGPGQRPGGSDNSSGRTAGRFSRPTPVEDGSEVVRTYGRDVDVRMSSLRLVPPEGEPGPTSSYVSQQLGSGLDMPSTGLAQESTSPLLGGLAIGDVLLATFPGEPISDVSFNFRTRVVEGYDEVYQGYHWPDNPDWIRERIGENFSETCLEDGFDIAVQLSIANAWQGYFVTRWEYENRNHYRESLTPYGPDSADYVNTALVDLAAELQGDGRAESRPSAVEAGDSARREAIYRALVAAEESSVRGYRASIPPAGDGVGEPVAQPTGIERFRTATFAWVGGSNAVDLPRVILQRRTADGWTAVADSRSHRLVVLTDHPPLQDEPQDLPARERTWRVAWEVPWDADPGRYRFVVTGTARGTPGDGEPTFFDPAGANRSYELASDPFTLADAGAIPLSEEYTSVRASGGRVTGRIAFEAPFRAIDRPSDGTELPVDLVGEGTVEASAAYDTDGFYLDEPVAADDVRLVVERGAYVDSAGNPTERVDRSV
jgi:hypothetical protein